MFGNPALFETHTVWIQCRAVALVKDVTVDTSRRDKPSPLASDVLVTGYSSRKKQKQTMEIIQTLKINSCRDHRTMIITTYGLDPKATH